MRSTAALIVAVLVLALVVVAPAVSQGPDPTPPWPAGEWWITGDVVIQDASGATWTLHLGAPATAVPTLPSATPIPPTATAIPTNTPRSSATPLPATATPVPTQPPAAAVRSLSLVADPAFKVDALPSQTRLWYDRAWYAVRSDRQYPDAQKAAESGDNYLTSRTLDNHITALATILAATGDPAALEEIWRLGVVARAQYADTGRGYLGLVWKYCTPPEAPGCNTDDNGLDESLLFGFQARMAFILDANRHLDPKYGEAADWWAWVGLEQQWPKWVDRKGFYDWPTIYPWAAELDNWDYLTLDKSLTHAFSSVMSGWLLYGAMLDDAEHLAEGERRAAVLLSMMEGTTSWTWDHRVPDYNKEPYGCQPSGYAAHAASMWFFNYLADVSWFTDAAMKPIARTWGNLFARADTTGDTWPGTVCGTGSDRLARLIINNVASYALWDTRIAADAERVYNDQQSPNQPQSLNIPASLTLYYAVQEGVVTP